jgi:hypothetical protein
MHVNSQLEKPRGKKKLCHDMEDRIVINCKGQLYFQLTNM